MDQQTNKNALITGASRGLGLALARKLAENQWTVIIDARDGDALDSIRQELSSVGKVVAIRGDVADPNHRDSIVEAAWAIGGLNLIVNNASILGSSPQPSLLDYPLEILEEVFRVNTFAPIALLQSLRHHVRDGIKVINISSDAGVEPYEGWGGYGSSKAALEHMSAILSIEMPMWRVYWVDPGEMQTQLLQEAFPNEDISDRPLPDNAASGLLRLINGKYPSGRYVVRELLENS